MNTRTELIIYMNATIHTMYTFILCRFQGILVHGLIPSCHVALLLHNLCNNATDEEVQNTLFHARTNILGIAHLTAARLMTIPLETATITNLSSLTISQIPHYTMTNAQIGKEQYKILFPTSCYTGILHHSKFS